MATRKIFIDGEKYEINAGLILGEALHNIAGISGSQQLLLERDSDIDVPILAVEHIIIDGGERFSIGDGSPPIEENPCLRKPIRFYLNGEKIDKDKALTKPKISGSDLKALDPHSDPTDGLFADLDDLADEPVDNNMRLVIQDKDHFITTPCGNVGDMPLLPDLIGKHYKQVLTEYPNAELHEHGDQYLLILPNVELPEEWIPKIVDLLILIPQGYPAAALDMFFVSPNIKLPSGQQPDRGDHFESFLGKNWQRFSWHYQSRKWNPSRDTLSSHINFCLSRFALKK